MTAALSDRDREILSAWLNSYTGLAELAGEVGLDVLELIDWAARPDIAALLESIHAFALTRARTFLLACKSASLARLLQIVERGDDERDARRAASAILRCNPRALTSPTKEPTAPAVDEHPALTKAPTAPAVDAHPAPKKEPTAPAVDAHPAPKKEPIARAVDEHPAATKAPTVPAVDDTAGPTTPAMIGVFTATAKALRKAQSPGPRPEGPTARAVDEHPRSPGSNATIASATGSQTRTTSPAAAAHATHHPRAP